MNTRKVFKYFRIERNQRNQVVLRDPCGVRLVSITFTIKIATELRISIKIAIAIIVPITILTFLQIPQYLFYTVNNTTMTIPIF